VNGTIQVIIIPSNQPSFYRLINPRIRRGRQPAPADRHDRGQRIGFLLCVIDPSGLCLESPGAELGRAFIQAHFQLCGLTDVTTLPAAESSNSQAGRKFRKHSSARKWSEEPPGDQRRGGILGRDPWFRMAGVPGK